LLAQPLISERVQRRSLPDASYKCIPHKAPSYS
jgi:hypothetical protein